MKADIRYPFLFRAHPGRCVEPKDVLVPFVHTHDVPEVSSSETDTVFRSGRYTLRQYDGRLFSLVGKPGSESAQACLDHAFETEERRSKPWWIPSRADERGHIVYAAKPLDNWAYHRLFLKGEGKARESMLWPPLIPDYTGGPGYRNRNQFTYQELEGKLRDVDAEQYHRGRAEHAAEAGRLLIIGGSYWIETTPPAIYVEHKGNGRMYMGFAHLPDWLDANLGRQYFPLTAREEALDYARRAQAITEKPDSEPGDYVDGGDFELEVSPAFEFDFKSYSVKRTTLLLGGDMARVLSGHPDLEQKVGEKRARSVYLARDAAKACGTDYEEWPDVSELAHDVTEAWKMTGRKPGWTTIPPKRHEFGTLVCERAVSMVDDLPIAVPAATGWRPGR